MKQVLVTDRLFVTKAHERLLEDAGFAVARIDDPAGDEATLINALQGKAGYIIGGTETVTSRVIAAADSLEAIAHTGSAINKFIPAANEATARGIAIANVPDGHTQAVAEWMQAAALAMTRGFFGRYDEATSTTPGLEEQTIGIVGLGRIGTRLAQMVQPFRPEKVLYYSQHPERHTAAEQKLGVIHQALPELLRLADVVFLAINGDVGPDFFGAEAFAAMKPGALLVSSMIPGVVNEGALLAALEARKIHAISDYPMASPEFASLPPNYWHSNKAKSTAFNTVAGLEQTGSQAVHSVINLLTTGDDGHLVNPEYKQYARQAG